MRKGLAAVHPHCGKWQASAPCPVLPRVLKWQTMVTDRQTISAPVFWTTHIRVQLEVTRINKEPKPYIRAPQHEPRRMANWSENNKPLAFSFLQLPVLMTTLKTLNSTLHLISTPSHPSCSLICTFFDTSAPIL